MDQLDPATRAAFRRIVLAHTRERDDLRGLLDTRRALAEKGLVAPALALLAGKLWRAMPEVAPCQEFFLMLQQRQNLRPR